MPGVRRHTIWALTIILAFVGGVVAGVYYQAEVMVWVRSVWDTDTASVTPGPLPSVRPDQSIIVLPSLTEPLPLVYSETLEEEQVQRYLKEGAVVLPLGTSFGGTGNVVVTAHSSGTEAFGPYRFAFAKLADLEAGNEFTVKTPTAAYTYRVYHKEVVWPHEVDKLPKDERATVTLVTCWPLWTNFKRLLVHSELVKTEFNI